MTPWGSNVQSLPRPEVFKECRWNSSVGPRTQFGKEEKGYLALYLENRWGRENKDRFSKSWDGNRVV